MSEYHVPVLLQESIDALEINPKGIYVDVTFGGGGHSQLILSKLDGGKLFAFDQDPDAENNLIENESFVLIPQNFMYLKKFLRLHNVKQVDGVLGDLGISSHQIDTADRGFSYRFNAPLDMRMDQGLGISAETIVNEYNATDLKRVFQSYGEFKGVYSLVDAIGDVRNASPIKTTFQLKELAIQSIKSCDAKCLAQIFQALRIEVNEEMKALEELLVQSGQVIKPGGRLVLLAYHSLESRLIKNYLRSGTMDGNPERDMYGKFETPFKVINKKVITATEAEIKLNKRARSAVMRIGEKL
ncbi:UNVERIFIED_CONTAM: hypothetical protein GTU68_044765 [Idotea baltica]|nr:hypothetical protein [Idotea baltica]